MLRTPYTGRRQRVWPVTLMDPGPYVPSPLPPPPFTLDWKPRQGNFSAPGIIAAAADSVSVCVCVGKSPFSGLLCSASRPGLTRFHAQDLVRVQQWLVKSIFPSSVHHNFFQFAVISSFRSSSDFSSFSQTVSVTGRHQTVSQSPVCSTPTATTTWNYGRRARLQVPVSSPTGRPRKTSQQR